MSQLKPKNSALVKKLDSSYIERAIIALWQINIENLITNKVQLAKNFHIQPSEIDKMPMWEYEMFMRIFNKAVEDENKKQKDEMDKYDLDSYKKMSNPSNMNKMMKQNTPSVPNISINMPKM